MFFPRLFEEYDKEVEFSNISIAVLRDEILGIKDKYKLSYDSGVDIILSVDNMYAEDIITWEYVSSLKNTKYKTLLIDYLTNEVGIENLHNELNDIKKKQKKNNSHQKEGDFGVTHGDFWQYRIDSYDKEEKSTSTSSQSYILDLTLPEYKDILDYFVDGDKSMELTEFAQNAAQTKDSFVFLKNFIRKITDLLHDKDRIEIGVGGINDHVFLKKENYESWKEDILEYIGKYDSPEELNEVYESKILKKGSFLNYIFNIEPAGLGRGEFLIAYTVKGARLSGGEDYDIIIDGKGIYEVKEYSGKKDATANIRLGTHGKLSQFDFFNEIKNSVKTVKRIWNNMDEEELKKIVGPYNFRYWKYMASEDDFKENTRAIPSAVNSGELTLSRLRTIIEWHYLNHVLVYDLDESDTEELYTTAILKGNKIKPILVKIDPIESKKIGEYSSIKISSLEDRDKLINELKDLKYIRNPHLLIEDIENSPKQYFEKVKERIKDKESNFYFIVFESNTIKILNAEDFQFSTITQSSVKISEKKADKENFPDFQNLLDKYKSMDKSDTNKNFVNMFRDNFKNESFFPRLHNF